MIIYSHHLLISAASLILAWCCSFEWSKYERHNWRVWYHLPLYFILAALSATGMLPNLLLRKDLWYEAGSINCSMFLWTRPSNKTLIAFSMHESGPMFWKRDHLTPSWNGSANVAPDAANAFFCLLKAATILGAVCNNCSSVSQ